MPDREKVKKELLELNARAYELWVHDQKNEFLAQIGNVTYDVMNLLKEQEAKTGEWIPVTNGRGGMECSICHDYAPSYQNCAEYLSKYCPNCGAKMEGR